MKYDEKDFVFAFIILGLKNNLCAQKDTSAGTLDSITVNSYLKNQLKQKLPDVYETFIYAGKKTDLVSPDASKGNIAQNAARPQFAQIAGLTTWDMDGA